MITIYICVCVCAPYPHPYHTNGSGRALCGSAVRFNCRWPNLASPWPDLAKGWPGLTSGNLIQPSAAWPHIFYKEKKSGRRPVSGQGQPGLAFADHTCQWRLEQSGIAGTQSSTTIKEGVFCFVFFFKFGLSFIIGRPNKTLSAFFSEHIDVYQCDHF